MKAPIQMWEVEPGRWIVGYWSSVLWSWTGRMFNKVTQREFSTEKDALDYMACSVRMVA